ncbi:hypothetical protein GCM10008106_08270 [Mongoliitalea lutea]|uniref:6-bladed beta-propeller protein n=2 Tax=Mongoliitalea lutea TaxID=849756 RepID=A0A8J3G4Q0_9BACT|nr:hypothetical protein GCM10008106_08270 [Mongoliitalea lutea]
MLLASCKKAEVSGLLTIDVTKNTEKELALSDISASVIKISLENHEDALITTIKEVVTIDSYFVVITYDSRILIFDQDGLFVNAVGKKGEGPGEHRFISAFAKDEDSRKFYVVSSKKVLVYSFDFQLIDEFTLDYYISNLSIQNNNIYVVSNAYEIPVEEGYATETSLYVLDKTFASLDTIPLRRVVRKDRQASILGYNKFISTDGLNTFIYAPVATNEGFLRDTIFQIAANTVVPYAKLRFAEPHVDEKGIKTYWIANIFSTANYLGAHYYKEANNIHFFLYDRNTSKRFNFKGGPLDDEGDVVVLNLLDASTDTFYYVKTDTYADVANEEQNPIIGIVKLK